MSTLLMAMALATAPSAVHEVSLDHGGVTRQVTYQAHVNIQHKQKGFVPAGRVGTVRCDWTATVSVHRQVAGGATRVLAGDRRLSGTRPGDCLTNRSAIAKAVEARRDEVREHLQAAADHDRALLIAELGSSGASSHAR